jgi:hypothetical protein
VILLVILAVLTVVGMKFFPFSKLIKLPTGDVPEMNTSRTEGHEAPNSLYFDFEVIKGQETPGGFYKGIAHSGEYSVKAFGKNSFSYAIERKASDIGLQNLQAVALSAWIYVFPTNKEVKGSFVFTASNDLGVNLCWKGVSLVEPEIPQGKWFKISGYYDLKEVAFQPGTKLQVYFWNTSSTDILIDDYFIVFGGTVDRRGDSALVDLTRPGGYQPRYNFPPFPVSYLDAVNTNDPFPANELSVGDLPVTGHFFSISDLGLIVVRKNGTWSAFSSCSGLNGKMVRQGAGKLGISGSVISLHKGRFVNDPTDQLLVQTEEKIYLFKWGLVPEPCQEGSALQTSLMVSSESSGSRVCTGRFTGLNRTELMLISQQGDSKMFAVETDQEGRFYWKTRSVAIAPADGSWDASRFYTQYHSGRFLTAAGVDQVLSVSRSVRDGVFSYNLFIYNAINKKWISTLKNPSGGRIIGIDTLKPEDKFFLSEDFGQFSGHFAAPAPHAIYRYNRDWRFDLKIISFNDTSYTIHENIDFRGYPTDQNPKFYETLWLIPATLNDKHQPAFLVAGKNRSVTGIQKILPDFTRYYEITTKK